MTREKLAEIIDGALRGEDFDTSGPVARDDGTIGIAVHRFDSPVMLVLVGGG